MDQFVRGDVNKDDLRVLFIKDKEDVSRRSYTYATMLCCNDIFALSTVKGGDRIKVLSYGHGLNDLGFRKFYSNSGFAMNLSAAATIIDAGGASLGLSPPYNAILYDAGTNKPLSAQNKPIVMFDESLGIAGQDNIFIRADSTSRDDNILNMQPGS